MGLFDNPGDEERVRELLRNADALVTTATDTIKRLSEAAGACAALFQRLAFMFPDPTQDTAKGLDETARGATWTFGATRIPADKGKPEDECDHAEVDEAGNCACGAKCIAPDPNQNG